MEERRGRDKEKGGRKKGGVGKGKQRRQKKRGKGGYMIGIR